MSLVDIYENEIKPRVDYANELQELEPVKKSSDCYKLICPQCKKKNAFLYANTGFITCNHKNSCGHTISFLAYKNGGSHPRGKEFIDCIKDLGAKYGIIIDDEKVEKYIKIHEKKEKDQQTLTQIWQYFISLFPNSKAAKYIEARKFPLDQKLFGMYPTVDHLEKWIVKQNLDLPRCKDLGVIRGDFEGCLIGVWRDQCGDICNFWVRALDGREPKYNRLKKHPNLKQEHPQGAEAVKGKHVIWVEGYLDVIAASLSGILNVVGCGTATVPDKALQVLKPREVILCLDNDSAGRDGTYKFIEKHRNNPNLNIFIASIAYEGCKDLADVYEKYGTEAVKEVFNKDKLIHGLTFAANYLLEKNKGKEWNEYNRIHVMEDGP